MLKKNGTVRVYELVLSCKRYEKKKSKLDTIFKVSIIAKNRIEATKLVFEDVRFKGLKQVLMKYTKVGLNKKKIQKAFNLIAVISNRLVIGDIT